MKIANSMSFIITILVSFIIVCTTSASSVKENLLTITDPEDFNPLVDNIVTVEIQEIRSLEKVDFHNYAIEMIDWMSDPDFFIKVYINGEEFTSDIWHDTKYLYNIDWSASLNVPENEEFVDIKIQLWDWNSNKNKLCDISGENGYDVELTYSTKTGHWMGDDAPKDSSGYGRLNGCDDGSIYKRNRDCEVWFDIYQNDFDGDGIPYWTEVNIYGTDPLIDNSGDDLDNDDIPIEWEWKWGYNPIEWDDHTNLDPENDGINNIEEYLTSQWGSDPFRKDLFIELDQMEESPTGEKNLLPERAKELLYTVHNRQNLVYHLDDGRWNESGSEMVPFDELSETTELKEIYRQYFLHGDEDNWRRGVFHYGVVIYRHEWASGCAFGRNRFQISSEIMERKARVPYLNRDICYASSFMHETGHTLGFNYIPGHDPWSKYPWQIGWWINRPYKSCMNYGYAYTLLDYSDGSRRFPDLDDWSRMDLTYFQT